MPPTATATTAAITPRRRGHGLGSRSSPWLRMSSSIAAPPGSVRSVYLPYAGASRTDWSGTPGCGDRLASSGYRTSTRAAAGPERLADDQRGLRRAGLDDGHGQPAGARVPGRQLHDRHEVELGHQAVAAGRPAEAEQGVAADRGSRHLRQPAVGDRRDVESHGQRAIEAVAELERDESAAWAQRGVGGGTAGGQRDRARPARREVE